MDDSAKTADLRRAVFSVFSVHLWEIIVMDRELYCLVSAVVEVPQDETRRGMLADFLEERGDPRAADVRATVGRRPYEPTWSWADYTVDDYDRENDRSELLKELYGHFKAAAGVRRVAQRSDGSSYIVSLSASSAWELFARGFARWLGIPEGSTDG